MAYTTIDDPTIYFNTKIFTGNNSANNSITGVGFQPDWIWFKNRNAANDHALVDSVRGRKALSSNNNSAELTLNADKDFQSFDSDGFTVDVVEQLNSFNKSGDSIVTWNWKAGGSASSNSNGDLTSTVSVNQTAGFSICQWTSSDTGLVKTVGHGLGVKPDWILWKSTSRTVNWINFHVSTGKDKNAGWLDQTSAASNQNYWGNTEPTSTVFSTEGATEDSGTNIAYCFAAKQGYSKFGSYTGNGNADGPFIYTGFKPAWVMIKRTDSAEHWQMSDNKRNTFNVVDKGLFASGSFAESSSSSYYIDYLSNGFKLRNTATWFNASGGSYIFMAFAESPFVNSNGVPNNAR